MNKERSGKSISQVKVDPRRYPLAPLMIRTERLHLKVWAYKGLNSYFKLQELATQLADLA